MSKSSLILLIFTTYTLQYVYSQAQPPTHQSLICNYGSGMTYTADSPYGTNLKTVFTTLQTQSSTSAKSYNTSSGTGTDTVYGQYYCRGDIDTNLCADCIKGATNWALNNCTLAKGGMVINDDCTMRYSNHSMYGILEVQADTPPSTVTAIANVSDQVAFPDVWSNTVNKIVDEAVHTGNLFAMGEGKVSANETVYCLVQCSPDLSGTQCKTCLESLYGYISTPRGQWPALFYAFHPSCQMMYNAEAVFYSSVPTVPATSPPPTTSVTAPSPQLSPSAETSLLTVSQPPLPSNGGSTIVRSSEGMKVRVVIALLLILTTVLNQ